MGGNRLLWTSGPKDVDPSQVHAVLPLSFDTVMLGLGEWIYTAKRGSQAEITAV